LEKHDNLKLIYEVKYLKIYLHKKFNGVFPVSARDFSLASINEECDKKFKYILAKSCENSNCPEVKGTVRAHLYFGGWIF